jgi:uroporphyrinogen decarboxylase
MIFDGVPYFRMPRNGYYFDRIFNQLSYVENRRQLEEAIPEFLGKRGLFGITNTELGVLSKWGREACHHTDYAILGDPYLFSMYHLSLEIFGYQKFFMLMASDPDLVHAWMEALSGAFERFFERYLGAVGEYIQVLLMWDDYGTQTGLQISPAMFRELFRPYVTRVLSFIRERAPHVKIMLHACGSVAPLIPDFIEMGFDALNPVQTTARNMEPEMLKREFGREMTFWGGGVSAQTTLLNGSVEDIRNEVREKMAVFKPGGGYVFTTDHDIQEHVSPEKILAIYRAAQEFRDY